MNTRLSILATAGLLTVVTTAITSMQSPPQSLPINPVASFPVPAPGLPTTPVHPDEPVSDTLTQRFSLKSALERLQQVDQALDSFRQLTEKSQGSLEAQTMKAVGNTDPETQTLGFHNWVGSVEGTLRHQDYQIKKLEWELAQKQHQDGEISKAELDQKAIAYQQAVEEFRKFWKTFKIAD